MKHPNEDLVNPVIEAEYINWNIHGTRKNGAWFVITEPTGKGSYYKRFYGICEYCCFFVKNKDDRCPWHPTGKIIPIHLKGEN